MSSSICCQSTSLQHKENRTSKHQPIKDFLLLKPQLKFQSFLFILLTLPPLTFLLLMAFSKFSLLLSLLLLSSFLFLSHPVLCDHEEDNLYKGINEYRKSLNLTTLTKNDNADCLASRLADQFKNQPCTNTTGANTVPGTEPQFPNYPNILAKCDLNVSITRDGAVMPACIPGMDSSLVLSNFTKSLYSENLNDTKFSGIGIGSEKDWIVVVLTTSTPEGSYSPATANGADMISKISVMYCSVFLLLLGNMFVL